MTLSLLRPMDAVVALYSEGAPEVSEAIIASLSQAVFGGRHLASAGALQRLMARISYRILKWTTTSRRADDEAGDAGAFRNRLLRRTGHPYARALLDSSSREAEALVEGGDPMNGPYMMLAPEILAASNIWDRIFLHSVQGKDVQLRFIWETCATYEAARRRLEQFGSVRMKTVAAGTGLSMILAYDRLIRDGFDPARITVRITDRDQANIDKSTRLLAKLTSHRGRMASVESEGTISAGMEDIFASEPGAGAISEPKYDVISAVGILEYFQGFTYDTTERCLRLLQPDETPTAQCLTARLGKMTTDSAALIVNTSRLHPSTRILELFGKRFDYRNRDNLSELMATANVRNPRLVGSGHIYDIEVYEKSLN
ncbi:MAG: hypothetical protein ABI318_01845 [Chthoniobacteraceae bacterium]